MGDSQLPGQHYTSVEQVPAGLTKYYHQRYQIFSRYDEGVRMTDDAWYGVTPEPVAIKIAEHASKIEAPDKHVIIDCFAGVGGNAIAFATSGHWSQVIAIEHDPETLACAKHNAEVYGVQNHISWHQGDCFSLLGSQLACLSMRCVIFASPPWGGPAYKTDAVFDVFSMRPYNFIKLTDAFTCFTDHVILYLPRNTNMWQVAKTIHRPRRAVVVHYCMAGASKALCVYLGGMIPGEL